METQTFYSNGKLLLTGEYVVLDGAKALAVPTRFGQNLIVKKVNNQQINGQVLMLIKVFGLKKLLLSKL